MYKPKGIKNEHMLNMRRTYGASMSQHHFAYLIKNPILPPSAREALTKEAGYKRVESGKAYSRNTLKTQTYCEKDGNWIHLAEDLEFWKKEVEEKKKFHYSYHTKSPSPKRSHRRNRSTTLGMTGYARTNWYQNPRRQGVQIRRRIRVRTGRRPQRRYLGAAFPL